MTADKPLPVGERIRLERLAELAYRLGYDCGRADAFDGDHYYCEPDAVALVDEWLIEQGDLASVWGARRG